MQISEGWRGSSKRLKTILATYRMYWKLHLCLSGAREVMSRNHNCFCSLVCFHRFVNSCSSVPGCCRSYLYNHCTLCPYTKCWGPRPVWPGWAGQGRQSRTSRLAGLVGLHTRLCPHFTHWLPITKESPSPSNMVPCSKVVWIDGLGCPRYFAPDRPGAVDSTRGYLSYWSHRNSTMLNTGV